MYKTELQKEIITRLQQFLQEEIGNRITLNNMTGLSISLGPIFERNLIRDEIKKEK